MMKVIEELFKEIICDIVAYVNSCLSDTRLKRKLIKRKLIDNKNTHAFCYIFILERVLSYFEFNVFGNNLSSIIHGAHW